MLANEMVIFYYVVQTKSFSKAAQMLGVSKSFVSKRISQLEKALKSSLLSRSTRQLQLTEAGEVFYQHCQALAANAEHGFDAMMNLRGKPAGMLKISAPFALGMHLLAPLLTQFNQDYPEVKLNVVLESRMVDLIRENYDLALRAAVLPDSNLIAKKILTIRNFLCASPDYLKTHGPLTSPQQLTQQCFALYVADKPSSQIKLMHHQQDLIIMIQSSFESNNLDLIKQMTLAGRYISILPEFMINTAIEQKQLTICLPKYRLPETPLYALYPEKDYIPLKVKIFLNLLKTYLSKSRYHPL